MDTIEESGKAGEERGNDLTEAQKQLSDLDREFRVTDVLKTVLWMLVVFALFRFSLFILMDEESKRQLDNTIGFNIAVLVPSLFVGAMLHSSRKGEERKRIREKIKSLTPDDGLLVKQAEAGEKPPKASQPDQAKGTISKRQLVWGLLQLVGVLMLLGLLILLLIGIVTATVDFCDPDIFKNSAFFQNDTVQFFMAVFQVVGFFGGLFLIIFTFVIGGHAAVSKDPIEKNLSGEVLKKRLKRAAALTVALTAFSLWVDFELKKFRDWWHKKS